MVKTGRLAVLASVVWLTAPVRADVVDGPTGAPVASVWGQMKFRPDGAADTVTVNGTQAVAIHAADGTPIGAAPTEALAIAAILQHEMAPVLVH